MLKEFLYFLVVLTQFWFRKIVRLCIKRDVEFSLTEWT